MFRFQPQTELSSSPSLFDLLSNSIKWITTIDIFHSFKHLYLFVFRHKTRQAFPFPVAFKTDPACHSSISSKNKVPSLIKYYDTWPLNARVFLAISDHHLWIVPIWRQGREGHVVQEKAAGATATPAYVVGRQEGTCTRVLEGNAKERRARRPGQIFRDSDMVTLVLKVSRDLLGIFWYKQKRLFCWLTDMTWQWSQNISIAPCWWTAMYCSSGAPPPSC